MSNMFRRISHFVAAIVLVCCILMFSGCAALDAGDEDVDIEATVTVNNNTGGISVSYTIHSHPPLQEIAAWIHQVSGITLASFDPNQAVLNIALSNATISSTTGTVTVTLTDVTTGQVAGQQSFEYVTRGNSVFAQDPTAISNWLQQFSSLSNVAITTSLSTALSATNAGSASATANAQYSGVTYASTTVNFSKAPIGGIGCHTKICPIQ